MHWFARRSWLRLGLFDDDFFDFSEAMGMAELAALEAFVTRRAPRTTAAETATDRLFIRARAAHQSLDAGDITAFETMLTRYRDAADAALAALRTPGIVAARTHKISREADFSLTDARAALRDFAQTALGLGLSWYVISGTFLGIIREGGWLKHDYDIDLGVHAENFDLAAATAGFAASKSFVIRKLDTQTRFAGGGAPRLERLPVLLKLVHSSGINVDVFVHYLEQGSRWHGSNIHRWDNADFALATYELDGLAVAGPAEAERYLTENYGDWRVPVTDFNSTTGTPNLTIVRNLFSVALFLKRAADASNNGQPREACAILERLARSGALSGNQDSWRFDPSFVRADPVAGIR